MTLVLPDPLVAAPFKMPNSATPEQIVWFKTHAWPIRVMPMRKHHAKYWDETVFPRIKQIESERQRGMRPGEPARADAYWRCSWTTYYRIGAFMATWSHGTLPHWTPTIALAIEAATHEGSKPVGMIFGLQNMPFPRSSQGRICPTNGVKFVWLITAAPAELLAELGVPYELSLGKTLLDTAIQASYAMGSEGWCLLHIDPKAAMASFGSTGTYAA